MGEVTLLALPSADNVTPQTTKTSERDDCQFQLYIDGAGLEMRQSSNANVYDMWRYLMLQVLGAGNQEHDSVITDQDAGANYNFRLYDMHVAWRPITARGSIRDNKVNAVANYIAEHLTNG